MDGPQNSSPSDQSTTAGDGLASTLDQLAALMAQAEELASWASSTRTTTPESASTWTATTESGSSEPEACVMAGSDVDADSAVQVDSLSRLDSLSPLDADHTADSPGEDPIGAALMSMVADGRIAAVVVSGEGSAEVLGKPRCVEESSLAALGSLAPTGAVLEVTTTQGELRALRVGNWTFAVEVGATVPDDVDTLLGELLALSQEGIAGADL
ncbi:MAG: hypothetical protein ACP5P1_01865 [Acidimicrobiales bacterium]